jgi:hypothetical protein
MPKWWNWILNIPAKDNPLNDATGSKFEPSQSVVQPAVFLAHAFGGSVFRIIQIFRGLGIVFPIYTEVATQQELTPGQPLPTLFKLSRDKLKAIQHVEVHIQDKTLIPHHLQSQMFVADVAKSNVLGIPPGQVQAVSDGYWIILPPPPPGTHVIESVWGTAEERLGSVKYHIKVSDSERATVSTSE